MGSSECRSTRGRSGASSPTPREGQGLRPRGGGQPPRQGVGPRRPEGDRGTVRPRQEQRRNRPREDRRPRRAPPAQEGAGGFRRVGPQLGRRRPGGDGRRRRGPAHRRRPPATKPHTCAARPPRRSARSRRRDRSPPSAPFSRTRTRAASPCSFPTAEPRSGRRPRRPSGRSPATRGASRERPIRRRARRPSSAGGHGAWTGPRRPCREPARLEGAHPPSRRNRPPELASRTGRIKYYSAAADMHGASGGIPRWHGRNQRFWNSSRSTMSGSSASGSPTFSAGSRASSHAPSWPRPWRPGWASTAPRSRGSRGSRRAIWSRCPTRPPSACSLGDRRTKAARPGCSATSSRRTETRTRATRAMPSSAP